LPGVDPVALKSLFDSNALLGMLDMFSGGALRNFSVAAMGVYPYITSTIIIQLLQPVIPALMRLSQEGEAGRDKVNRISHWLTIPLAALVRLRSDRSPAERRGNRIRYSAGNDRDGLFLDRGHVLPGLVGRTDY
jgi:hypothetical protein